LALRLATALGSVIGMSLFEIRVEIVAGGVEAADNILLELGEAGWSVHEDAIAKRAWIAGIFADEQEAKQRLLDLTPLLEAVGVSRSGAPVTRAIADCDWRDSYKAHFHAWQFGRLHWVPVWERATFRLPEGHEVLWLDPGLAFGTGNHETTRLCVERLVSLAANTGTIGAVIDAGCGSGILALSAALLGSRDVSGFDNDPEAVRVSDENAALNGMTGRVRFAVADIETGLAGRTADILLANIQADILMKFAKPLLTAVAPGGSLVLSGILVAEIDAVRSVFAKAGQNWRFETRAMGEWSALWGERLR
jgi:ribosomal protein L11 methyltransferase